MLKACSGLLLALATASGADFTGIWTGTAADRNGDLQDLSFRFTQNSNGVLTGKMYGDNESIPITDGKLEDDHVSFLITTELNGSITKTLYAGTLVNGEIHVVRKRVGAPAVKVPEKPDPEKKAEKDTPPPKPAPLVLKRL